MTYTTTNIVLSAILSASVEIKPKTAPAYTTTVGKDGIAHLPKVSAIADENAIKAFKAIGNAYDFTVKARTASMGSKAAVQFAEKATDCLREYLSALGLPTTVDCLDALKAINALKASKIKGTESYAPTSTGRATYQKSVLKVTCLAIEAGSWNLEKVAGKVAKGINTLDELEQAYITTFGFSAEVAKRLVDEARTAAAKATKSA